MNVAFWRNKRVLVAGGAGFIGSHLVDALVPHAGRVTVVDGLVDGTGANLYNLRQAQQAGNFQFVEGRLESMEWKGLLDETDVAFNLASVNAHKESMKDPVGDAYRNLIPHLAFCTRFKETKSPLHVVFASSRSVYGRCDKSPVGEHDATMPLDFYSVHTLAAEHYYRLAAGAHRSATCLRFSNVYGPRQRMRSNDVGMWGELLLAALTDRPMKLYGPDGQRDSLHVADMVRAFILAAEKPEGYAVYNVGGQIIGTGDFCRAIQAVVTSARVEQVPVPEDLKAIQTGVVLLDAGPFKAKFGWDASTALDRGVRETVEFFMKNREYYL